MHLICPGLNVFKLKKYICVFQVAEDLSCWQLICMAITGDHMQANTKISKTSLPPPHPLTNQMLKFHR